MMSHAPLLAGVLAGTAAAGASIAVIGFNDEVTFKKIVMLNEVSNFLIQYKELKCSKDLFEKIVWVSPVNNSSTKQEIGSNKKIVLKPENTQGCISVWWQKETYGNNWRGMWNLIWAMKGDKYGTIFLSTVTANDGKIKEDRSFYILEKKEDKWTTIGNWSKDKEKINNSDASQKLIYPNRSLKDQKNGWDFIKENDFEQTSSKVCSKDKSCSTSYPDITQAQLHWKYTKSEDSSEYKDCKANEWSKNQEIFKTGTNALGDNLADIYTNVKGYYELEN